MRVIAIDYGDAKTGVAISDISQTMAGEVLTIVEKNQNKLIKLLTAIALERGAECFVVGLPTNMNGTEGPRAEISRIFARKLETASGLPCRLWDERLTSASARRLLHDSGKKSKKNRPTEDAVAAALILESYLQGSMPPGIHD